MTYSNQSGQFSVPHGLEYPETTLSGKDIAPWVVVSRFNEALCSRLLAGCAQRLTELGVPQGKIKVTSVPGAYELPLAADVVCTKTAATVVIALGVIIKGETEQHHYIATQVAQNLGTVALNHKKPIVFGVLVTDTAEQAEARAERGASYAEAAIELANKYRALGSK